MNHNLTDQELTVLKAMATIKENGCLMMIRDIIRALAMPRYAVKAILMGLAEKEVIALHHHDLPSMMSRDERKMCIAQPNNWKIRSSDPNYHYYHAAAVRD